MDYISQHPWVITLVSACFGAISISVTITLWLLTQRRNRKALTYQLKGEFPIATHHKKFSEALKVTFMDQPVSNLRAVAVRIRNAGSVAIDPGDFYAPVRIEFPPEVKVYMSTVSGSFPEGIEPDLKDPGQNWVTIAPTLLNSGYWVDIVMLADMPEDRPLAKAMKVSCSVKGAEITQVVERQQGQNEGLISLVGLMIGGAGLGIMVTYLEDYVSFVGKYLKDPNLPKGVGVGAFMVAAGLFFCYPNRKELLAGILRGATVGRFPS